MERDEKARVCPICKYPMKEINSIFFGLLFKCRNQSCPSKQYGDTARTPQELEEMKHLLDKTR